jgi:hypothetical protein
MDFSITTLEPVEQVKAPEVVIMTVLTMKRTTICPPSVEVSLQVQVRDHVPLTRRMHHQCQDEQLTTIDISAAKMTKTAQWQP